MTGNAQATERWEQGKDYEIDFWDKYIGTKGDRWPEDFAERLKPDLPLQRYITDCLDPKAPSVSILDVGAGPMTVLGKVWGNREVRLTAVDALAELYDKLLEKHGVEVPVRTEQCETERLLDKFSPGQFDLVHVRNALDHGFDVMLAIEQMLSVVKIGGHVVMCHFKNEAENENYVGFHQWNLESQGGDMIVWNKDFRGSVRESFASCAEIAHISPDGADWVVAILRKTAPTSLEQ